MSTRERRHRSVPFELIAHRAGNRIEDLRAVLGVADVVEVDVHIRRGELEVRHGKILWPTSRLWERWYLLPPDEEVPRLDDILSAVGPDVHLWLDLKGPDPRLARKVRPLIAERQEVTVSSKAWWSLSVFDDAPRVRRFCSAGNKFERFLLRWLPSRVELDGVVVNQRLLEAGWVQRLGAGHRSVFTWGVDSIERARHLIGEGVEGLILDDRELMARLRSERTAEGDRDGSS